MNKKDFIKLASDTKDFDDPCSSIAEIAAAFKVPNELLESKHTIEGIDDAKQTYSMTLKFEDHEAKD